MFVFRVYSRIPKKCFSQFRCFAASTSSLRGDLLASSFNKWTPLTVTQQTDHSFLGMVTGQRFGISSSASPERNEKEFNQSKDKKESAEQNGSASPEASQNEDQHENGSILSSDPKTSSDPNTNESAPGKKRRGSSSKKAAFSDSDSEGELSFDELVKLVAEKEELLKAKHSELEKMQDKVLRTYAEMENVIGRTKREAENSKKFAIQNFAKSLLDVADNLGRASSVVKDSFSKIDQSDDSVGAIPLLKTLLEGVEMTEKQLGEVLRKFGVEKFDPINEQFDPNRHLAVFQVPDSSKPADTVAAVLKCGYMLYDRVIRPAEVGVTHAPQEADQSSDA